MIGYLYSLLLDLKIASNHPNASLIACFHSARDVALGRGWYGHTILVLLNESQWHNQASFVNQSPSPVERSDNE